MKRSILSLTFCVLFVVSLALVVRAQQAPGAANAPAAARGPGAPGGVGRGRGGPPAPVPPQVAMPRPSAGDIQQANDALARFLASDSSAKSLLDKWPGLIAVQPPRANTAISPTPRAANRHAAFVELAKKGDIDLLLDGDSITDLWASDGRNADKKVVYDKYFGSYKPANFAISGDTTQGVLWGLQNGEGEGFQPKAIMLMIGTNNTGGNTPPEIAEGIGAIVLEMRKDFPNAKILLLAIFPRGNPGDPVRDRIAEINKIIAKLDDQQHIFYLDIGAKFLAADGTLDAVMPDRLHPNAKGYEIWGEAVKDKLATLMK